MRRSAPGSPVRWAAVALLAAAACGENGAGPTAPSEPQVVRIELAGPSTIAPGAAGQWTAKFVFPDATSRDATSDVVWRSTSDDIATVTSRGLVTAHKIGETTVQAAWGIRNASRDVVVVPPGTFRLTGVVTDALVPASPLFDARVEMAVYDSRFPNTWASIASCQSRDIWFELRR